jgi:hypothetical protein
MGYELEQDFSAALGTALKMHHLSYDIFEAVNS